MLLLTVSMKSIFFPFLLRFRSFSWHKILFFFCVLYSLDFAGSLMDPRHPHYYIRYRDKSSEITTYSCRHSSSHSDYLFRRCSNIGRDDLTHSWHFIYLNYWGKPVFSPHTIFYFFVSKIRVITQQEIHIRSGSFEDCLNNASPAIIHPRVCGGGGHKNPVKVSQSCFNLEQKCACWIQTSSVLPFLWFLQRPCLCCMRAPAPLFSTEK